jgi:hypothetical protein
MKKSQKTLKPPVTPPINAREQYYIKRGKKYYPVNDPKAYDGLDKGAWYVVVKNGCTSIRTAIEPKFKELDAALHYLHEGLVDAISDASKIRPTSVKLSEKEIKAWDAFEKIMGGKDNLPRYFAQYASYDEIARKGCEYLRKIMMENKMDIEQIKMKFPKRPSCHNAIWGIDIV